jgi:hypothetical protein
MNPHESAFAESFISKARRERALELLASSKNRHKFTSKFDHHGRDFIPECIRSIEPRHQHPPNITDILRAMGAPDTCHVIGGEHDGKDMELLAALKQIVGYGTGIVLSCIPGRLAYFEGEIRERFLLVRNVRNLRVRWRHQSPGAPPQRPGRALIGASGSYLRKSFAGHPTAIYLGGFRGQEFSTATPVNNS